MKRVVLVIAIQMGLILGVNKASWAQQALPEDFDPTDLSYQELAQAANTTYLSIIAEEIDKVSEATYPHDVKCLRKQIGYMKILVDLFVYAYPEKKGKKDPILKFRGFLDDGYEFYGDYKDEFDRDPEIVAAVSEYKIDSCRFEVPSEVLEKVYDQRRISEKQRILLDWSNKFAEKFPKNLEMLSKVEKRLVDRPKKSLSRFYWGGLDVSPKKKKLDGLGNIKRLQYHLLDKALFEYDILISRDEIHRYEDEEVFHDFRKRVRSVLRIDLFFPGTRPDRASDKLEEVEEYVGMFGDVNDLFLKYHDYLDEGNKKKAGKIRKQINKSWKELKKKLIKEKLKKKLKTLRKIYD